MITSELNVPKRTSQGRQTALSIQVTKAYTKEIKRFQFLQ